MSSWWIVPSAWSDLLNPFSPVPVWNTFCQLLEPRHFLFLGPLNWRQHRDGACTLNQYTILYLFTGKLRPLGFIHNYFWNNYHCIIHIDSCHFVDFLVFVFFPLSYLLLFLHGLSFPMALWVFSLQSSRFLQVFL